MDDLARRLGERFDRDQRAAEADDRHWSEVPISLFSAHRTLAEIAVKKATLARYEAAEEAMDRAMRDSNTGAYKAARAERQALRPVLEAWARVYVEEDLPDDPEAVASAE